MGEHSGTTPAGDESPRPPAGGYSRPPEKMPPRQYARATPLPGIYLGPPGVEPPPCAACGGKAHRTLAERLRRALGR